MARTDRTEYGGGPGAPQRFSDGSDIELTPSEAARVLRQVGHAVKKGNTDLTTDDVVEPETLANGAGFQPEIDRAAAVQADRVRRRKALRDKTNGYADSVPNDPDYNQEVS